MNQQLPCEKQIPHGSLYPFTNNSSLPKSQAMKTYHHTTPAQTASTFLTLLLLLFSTLPAMAQSTATYRDSMYLTGRAQNSFTREDLEGVRVLLLDAMGNAVDSTVSTNQSAMQGMKNICFDFQVLKGRTYTLQFSKKGYEPAETTVQVPNPKRYIPRPISIGPVLMRKNSYMLGEAVVKASKVMMVMKGDTIVYNADAFQLSEGSMLDALVSQLPGAKLEEGGRITVNGHFISSLLVNGRDFFRGDPRIALENLPAYTVDKIKVYQREPEDAAPRKWPEIQKADDPWVLDVNLKRYYAQGWIANAEVGAGTKGRYAARMFALRFTDHSRIAAYANLNNLNRDQRPGQKGEWSPMKAIQGVQTLKEGGAELFVGGKRTQIGFTTDIRAAHRGTDDVQETARTFFREGGDTYGRSRSADRDRLTDVAWNARLRIPFKKRGRGDIIFLPHVEYGKATGKHARMSAEFDRNPEEAYRGAALDSIFAGIGSGRLQKALINRYRNATADETERWKVRGSAQYYFRSPWTDNHLTLTATGDYGKQDARRFTRHGLHMPMEGTRDYRNEYTRMPVRDYHYELHAHQPLPAFIKYIKGCQQILTPIVEYRYRQSHKSDVRQLYRLDRLGDEWASDETPLGTLPSAVGALAGCIDHDNSYRTVTHTKIHTPQIGFLAYLGGTGLGSLTFNMPVNFRYDRISDFRGQDHAEHIRKGRTYRSIDPTILFRRRYLNIAYSFRHTPAELGYIIGTTDSSNPLYVMEGNPGLKASARHRLDAGYSREWTKKQRTVNASVLYVLGRRNVGFEREYDRTTGVTAYRPRNIDGNWSIDGKFGFSQAADRRKRIVLETATECRFANSADFYADEYTQGSVRSSVRNLNLKETLKADYRMDGTRIGLTAAADWRHATGDRQGFRTINSVDFRYGATAQAGLGHGITIDTDLTMYSRRGYDERNMNTDDFVWNAALSGSLLKGKMALRLSAFDILGQLSNVRRVLNAQGYAETWYNTIPRYVMLSVIYKLNIQPKRKTDE